MSILKMSQENLLQDGIKQECVNGNGIEGDERNELKMFRVYKDAGDGRSRSLVFKISRTANPAANESIVSPRVHKKRLVVEIERLNYKTLGSDECAEIKKEPSTSSEIHMPHSIPIKRPKEETRERRRSPRIRALQSKSNSNQSSDTKNQLVARKGKRKRADSFKKIKQEDPQPSVDANIPTTGTRNKEAKKRKIPVTFLPPEGTKGKTSSCSENPSEDFTHPSTMRLRSMLIISTPGNPAPSVDDPTESAEQPYPEFINVDPSHILRNAYQHKTISKSLKTGKAVSFFFPDQFNTHGMTFFQKNPCKSKNSHEYYFKKKKFDLSYLTKKYHMLDLRTLDKCYGLSKCSITQTEIMLSDIISGKEVLLECYKTNPEKSAYCSCGEPHKNMEIRSQRKYDKRHDEESDSFKLCREILVQSMKILNEEHSVL